MDRITSLESAFPKLIGSGYRLTSPEDAGYNCIAWAAGESNRWWWPDAMNVSYWPTALPRIETLASFVAAYATVGFVSTHEAAMRNGIEKLALYARDEIPTHAARQLANGLWTSKLGRGPDIEHRLEALTGEMYGEVAIILQRQHTVSELQ